MLALIGLGGAGETAIASELVSKLVDPAVEADRPDGLFVWSFAEFCDGDPASARRVEEPRLDSDTPEERRLARVLHAYERALSSRKVDLLVRFCIFRSGASIETRHSIFTRTRRAQPLRGPCGLR